MAFMVFNFRKENKGSSDPHVLNYLFFKLFVMRNLIFNVFPNKHHWDRHISSLWCPIVREAVSIFTNRKREIFFWLLNLFIINFSTLEIPTSMYDLSKFFARTIVFLHQLVNQDLCISFQIILNFQFLKLFKDVKKLGYFKSHTESVILWWR